MALAKDRVITMQTLFTLDLLVVLATKAGVQCLTIQNCFCRGSHTVSGDVSLWQSTFRNMKCDEIVKQHKLPSMLVAFGNGIIATHDGNSQFWDRF